MHNEMDCKAVAAAMPDLLFDPTAVSAATRSHLASCPQCAEELKGLQQTMGLLDSWEAPEPSPFWTARMGALLREEQQRPARGWAGFRERLRTRMWVNNRRVSPLLAGAAALLLVAGVGGGTWIELASQNPSTPAVRASNTVRDLQSINENAQVFQQMASLEGPDGDSGTD